MEAVALAGREGEIRQLRELAKAALDSQGSTVFLAGEAGVGKTRLTLELEGLVKENGFRVLRGQCLAESLVPLLPVKEALRSGALDHLALGARPPRLLHMYMIYNKSGILLSEAGRTAQLLDSEIMAGMLKAVGDFVGASLRNLDTRATDGLRGMEYGEYRFVLEGGSLVSLVAVVEGHESEPLRYDMRRAILDVEGRFASILADWDGDVESTRPIARALTSIIGSGMYDGVGGSVMDPKVKQEGLFDNILFGLKRTSTSAPVLLVLDDLHWADPTTLNVLHYLSRNTREDRVLIVGTYRPEDLAAEGGGRERPLSRTLHDMSREGLFTTIKIERFEDSSTLVNNILPGNRFGEEFMKTVQTETAGNPFFIIELLQLLVDEGHIVRDVSGAYVLSSPLAHIRVPPRIYDVIARRLSRLSEQQREILECASVIGRELDVDILESILEMKRIKLLKELTEIERSHALLRSTADTFRFDHTKIREVLYGDMPEAVRVEYHTMVADSYGRLFHDGEEVADRIAYHYYLARDPRVVDYAILAASVRRRDYANREALRLYTMALEHVEDGDERRVLLLRSIAEVAFLTGNWDAAVDANAGLVAWGERHDDERSIADARYSLGEILEKRDRCDEALETLNMALVIYQRLGDGAGEARCYREIGCTFWKMGAIEEARGCFLSGIGIAERIGDKRLLGALHCDMGNVYGQREEYALAEEHYLRSIRMLREAGDLYSLVKSYNNIGTLFWLFDATRALEYFEACIEVARRIGDVRGAGYGYANAAEALATVGGQERLERAVEYSNRAIGIFNKLGENVMMAVSLGKLGLVNAARGEWEEAERNFELAIDGLREEGSPQYLASNIYQLGLMHGRRGDRAEAARRIAEARDIWRGLGDAERVAEAEDALRGIEPHEV